MEPKKLCLNLNSTNNVLGWSDEEISKNVNLVLAKAISEINLSEESSLEYITFSYERLQQHLPLNDIKQLFDIASPAAEDILINTLEGIEGFLNKNESLTQTQINTNEACSHLLHICCSILQALQRSCENLLQFTSIEHSSVKSLLSAVFKLINHVFKHWKSRQKLYDDRLNLMHDALFELYKIKNNLLSQFLNLIANKIQFYFHLDEDLEAFEKLAEQFTSCALIAFELEVQVLVESWKYFLAFFEKYQERLKSNRVISNAVNQLCLNISKYLEDVLATSPDYKAAINLLKISNFFLKIVVKICRTLGSDLNESFNEVIALLIELNGYTPSYLRASLVSLDLIPEITRHLIIGADPLLSAIYSEDGFSSILQEKLLQSVETNPYGSVMLLLSLLKKLTAIKIRRQYFTSAINVLHLLFVLIEGCHGGMISGRFYSPGSSVPGQVQQSKDFYEYVYCSVAGFVLQLSPEEFSLVEETLLKSVLQTNPWRAMLAADLWCLVARYADSDLCHSTVEVLIQVLTKLEVRFPRPEFVYLLWLVRRLFLLCDHQYQETLRQKYPPQLNADLWSVLGLGNLAIQDTSDFFDAYMSMTSKYVQSLEPNIAQYQKVESSLLAASSISCQDELSERALEVMQDLWNFQLFSSDFQALPASYICVISIFTSSIISRMPPQLLLDILRQINRFLSLRRLPQQEISVLQILENMATVALPPEIEEESKACMSSSFKAILTSESPIVQIVALKTFAAFAHVTVHATMIELTVADDVNLQNDFINFLQKNVPEQPEMLTKIVSPKFQHHCPLHFRRIEENDPVNLDSYPKRFKFDCEDTSDAEDLKEVLGRFENDSYLLMKNVCRLTLEQKVVLRRVCGQFVNI